MPMFPPPPARTPITLLYFSHPLSVESDSHASEGWSVPPVVVPNNASGTPT